MLTVIYYSHITAITWEMENDMLERAINYIKTE